MVDEELIKDAHHALRRRTTTSQAAEKSVYTYNTRGVSQNGADATEASGCSKRLSSKAAASEDPEAYPLGYVESLSDARTTRAAFFSILLEAQPDAKQDGLGTKIQRELLPVIVGREVLVFAEQKYRFGQIALRPTKKLMTECP
jgi:hypothetical protein